MSDIFTNHIPKCPHCGGLLVNFEEKNGMLCGGCRGNADPASKEPFAACYLPVGHQGRCRDHKGREFDAEGGREEGPPPRSPEVVARDQKWLAFIGMRYGDDERAAIEKLLTRDQGGGKGTP
jgi:hypothetical protein